MPACRTLLALLLCASFAAAAELVTLSGDKVSGELTAISDKEVILRTATGPVATPLAQVLDIDLQQADALPKDAKYTDVELTDGSLLHCSQVAIKGKQVELTLLSGPQVTVPLDTVSYVLSDAHDEKNRQDWRQRFLGDKGNSDSLAVKLANGRVERLKGTFGEGDADGKNIQFDLNSAGSPRPVKLERVHGMLFLRTNLPAMPETLCKVHDTHRSLIVVAAAKLGETGFTFVTPAGAKIDYSTKLVQRFDFSKGKLVFVSDLRPVNKPDVSTEEHFGGFRANANLDNKKIRLRIRDANKDVKLQEYNKGLCLYAPVELEYELNGEYNEFKAVIGLDEIDEEVNFDVGPTQVRVTGDGRELFKAAVSRKDEPRAIAFSVKDVQRLRIEVSSGDTLNLHKRVTLVDPRVSK